MAQTEATAMTAPIATRTCTRTHRIAIDRLKGIQQLAEISLEDKPITGIFGPNGNGKSTVLHALAAAYQAPEQANKHHYWDFFPKLNEDLWNGTRFTVTHSGNLVTGPAFEAYEEQYSKGTATTRWKPMEVRRPIREVVYIGLKSCIPALERYSWHDLSGAISTPVADKPDQRALSAVGKILNSNYIAASRLSLVNFPKRDYITFERSDCGTYSSVTMGAGEQRLFEMLSIIERTRRYALILIDEIDVLLHGDALRKLIWYLYTHCKKSANEKQIVFTSHREELLGLQEWINIRHLYRDVTNSPACHRCFASTDPDSLRRLTGKQERPLEVFVEDDFAEAIVSQIAMELGIPRHVRIIRFGSSQNCFPVLAGLLIKGEKCDNSLFVLHGDVHLDPNERQNHINSACTGDDKRAVRIRSEMSSRIRDFVLPAARKPEAFLHGLIIAQNPNTMSPAEKEIHRVATEIVNAGDTHQFIGKLVEILGENRDVQITRVIPLAAKHAGWATYTERVREWLLARKLALNLI
jgi:RecA/RadA recombinase